jgi:hypothetical protein
MQLQFDRVKFEKSSSRTDLNVKKFYNGERIIKSMKLDSYLTPYIKANSLWAKNLSIRPDTVKILGKNRRKIILTMILAVSIGGEMTPKA